MADVKQLAHCGKQSHIVMCLQIECYRNFVMLLDFVKAGASRQIVGCTDVFCCGANCRFCNPAAITLIHVYVCDTYCI